MRIISIINLKGGVAKTFTAVQMGYLLSRKYNANVLMLDNDKQGNLSKLYGTYERDGLCDTAKLLLGECGLSEAIRHTAWKNLDIISSNMSLLTASAQLQADNSPDQCFRFSDLKNALDRNGKPYDFVIIDNPPDIGLNVINALSVTDDVIVPIKIDQWSLEGMGIITDQIEELKALNPQIKFVGALITMYQNNDTNKTGVEWLKTDHVQMFKTCIRYSDKATGSTLDQIPIEVYSPRSAAAVSYRRMVKEYLDMIGGIG